MPLDSVETAARFTRQTGLPSWVVVKRAASVVARAHAIAEHSGLDVAVEIDAATIALRFVVPPPREAASRTPSSRSLLRSSWARLARRPG